MTTTTRKTYIGKERDNESYLGDFGVRKYDYAAGRFTSPDVLWEKYMDWSPYQYCMNNPINLLDDNGSEPFSLTFGAGTALYVAGAVGIATVGWLASNPEARGNLSSVISNSANSSINNVGKAVDGINGMLSSSSMIGEKSSPFSADATSVAKSPLEFANLANQYQSGKLDKTSDGGNKKSPKMDGGNDEVWRRFKRDISLTYGA